MKKFKRPTFKSRHIGVISALLALFAMPFGAGARVVSDTLVLRFHQSKTDIDPQFERNSEGIYGLLHRIRELHSSDSICNIISAEVTGAASPEGNADINRRLSRQRAERILQEIRSAWPIPDSMTSLSYVGRDWTGLRALAEADRDIPYREEAIRLIQEIETEKRKNGEDLDTHLSKMKRLRGGRPYSYMLANLFPKLRRSTLILRMDIEPRPAVTAEASEALEVMTTDTMPSIEAIELFPTDSLQQNADTIIAPKTPLYLDVRTNLLYDAALLPTLGIEYWLGRGWSIVGNWTYGWWKSDRNHFYWRAYGGDITLRRWIGKAAKAKPLSGHHIGVYAMVTTYDFELGGKGYMGGVPRGSIFDRCNYGGGLEYGYSMPIGRHLNLDFSIGVGYLGGEYREYVPKDDFYLWTATKRRHWIGPTKAEISLTWLLGRGNTNIRKEKGGKDE